MAPTCGTCRFWREIQGTDGEGYCHRHPPVLNPVWVRARVQRMGQDHAEDLEDHLLEDLPASAIENVPAWSFPVLQSDEWCGEHSLPAEPSPNGSNGSGS